MKLGIYMGSFNPPHKGHIKIIDYLINNKIVDKVLVVPTLGYWDKKDLEDISDRINMLKFFENDKIIIDDKHNALVKTYELLKKLKEEYPNDKFYPIIGADNLVSFNKWHNYESLLKYPFIVIPRKGIDCKAYIQKFNSNFILLEDYPIVDITSTYLRSHLESDYLDERVKKYIQKNHLYEKKDENNEKKN